MSRSKLFISATAVLAALVMIVPVASVGAASGNSSGQASTQGVGTETVFQGLTFNNATDTFQFYVDVSGASTPLKVSTLDCCIAGDHWGVVLNDLNGGNPPPGTGVKASTACGNGKTTAYSGSAALVNTGASSFNGRALAEIRYCRGTDIFPAGMTVQYNSNGAITLTARSTTGP